MKNEIKCKGYFDGDTLIALSFNEGKTHVVTTDINVTEPTTFPGKDIVLSWKLLTH